MSATINEAIFTVRQTFEVDAFVTTYEQKLRRQWIDLFYRQMAEQQMAQSLAKIHTNLCVDILTSYLNYQHFNFLR